MCGVARLAEENKRTIDILSSKSITEQPEVENNTTHRVRPGAFIGGRIYLVIIIKQLIEQWNAKQTVHETRFYNYPGYIEDDL